MSYNRNNVWIEDLRGFINFTQSGLMSSFIKPTYRILAEGDSWFHIGGNTGFLKERNILDGVKFGNHHTMVLNMALSGDTMTNMSNNINSPEFFRVLNNYHWDGILLSAGGNDLIDALTPEMNYVYQDKLLSIIHSSSNHSTFENFINQTDLELFCDSLRESYQRFIDYKNKTYNKEKPIFLHTYDYFTPRNAPAQLFKFKKGPWVYNALTSNKVPEDFWQQITDHVINKLADTLLSLNGSDNFYVIDTRNTLIRADFNNNGDNNDWLNEIHPNSNGIKKLCKKLNKELDRIYK
jgi:hypothetical protein